MGRWGRMVEALSLRLDGFFGPLVYWLVSRFAKRGVPARVFEWLYRKPDPWRYLTSGYEAEKRAAALRLLPPGPYERALEVGCSEGVFTERLATSGVVREVVGIDVSSRAIARARERCAHLANVELLHANVLDAAPPGPFDLVFCTEVLYYLGADMDRVCDRLRPALGDRCRVVLVHGRGDRPLHDRVRELLGLRTVSERLETNAPRPYLVTVLETAPPTGRAHSA